MSIQINGSGASVADIQSGLATAAAVAAIQAELSGGAGIAAFPSAAAAANGVSLAEVVRYIQEHGTDGILATLGTPVNTNGTATLAAMIGDPANSSLVARLTALATALAGREQAISVNAPNHIAVIADMSSATWNTVGTHEVFTVTGAVRMRIWVESTVLTSEEDNSAWMSLGDEANPASIILSRGIDGSVLGFWNSSSGYVAIGFYSAAIFDFVLNGLDIGYGITLHPLLSGTLIFHCVWEPLSAGAMVLPGAGGPL